jgi:disulfide bond formation protein DsbB
MQQTRLYPILLAAVGAGSLTVAYVAQFGFGLEPCVLCLYQRIPYAVVAILGFSAMRWPHLLRPALALALGVFFIGAGIAFYHVGVEQHWWASATGCSGNSLSATVTTADLLKSLEAPPPKPCDAVDWTMLGISMAGWNSVFSLLCAGACAYALRRIKEH